MSLLLISYPKAVGAQYTIEVMSVPLGPILKLQSLSELYRLLEAPLAPNSDLPGNHLTIGLCRTQLLLSLPNADSASISISDDEKDEEDEISGGSAFTTVKSTCNKIQGLFYVAWDDFKSSVSTHIRGLARSEIQAMNALILKINQETITEVNAKKVFSNIKELFKVVNAIDGFFKSDNTYKTGIGINIDRQIEQLKEEIAEIKKDIT